MVVTGQKGWHTRSLAEELNTTKIIEKEFISSIFSKVYKYLIYSQSIVIRASKYITYFDITYMYTFKLGTINVTVHLYLYLII